jgi:DUF4097 and DUF4098 domain-containing protein YvlB
MILMISMLFLSVLPSTSTDDEWTKTYRLERSAKVRVDTSDANIHITSCDCSDVTARVTTRGWKIGGDGINVIDRQNGDQIDIEVKYPRQNFQINFGNNRRVDIELKVPRQADLDVHTGDGNVDATGVKGNIIVRSGDGNLKLSDLQGTLKADTGDGNIDMRNVQGDLTLHTGDGRIDVNGIDGSFRAETGDGRVHINGRFDVLDVKTGDGGIDAVAVEGSKLESNWRLNTGDGNLNLAIPATIAADIELHTSDGQIDFNLPVMVSGRQSRTEVRGQLNGGGKLLSLRTGDGSIRLEKR